MAGCFAGREAVFAVAGDLLITAWSDGVPIGTGPYSLLAAAAEWYMIRVSALPNRQPHAAAEADAQGLLHAAQGALATALA